LEPPGEQISDARGKHFRRRFFRSTSRSKITVCPSGAKAADWWIALEGELSNLGDASAERARGKIARQNIPVIAAATAPAPPSLSRGFEIAEYPNPGWRFVLTVNCRSSNVVADWKRSYRVLFQQC